MAEANDHASDGISNQHNRLLDSVVSKKSEDHDENLSSDQTEQLLHFQVITCTIAVSRSW